MAAGKIGKIVPAVYLAALTRKDTGTISIPVPLYIGKTDGSIKMR